MNSLDFDNLAVLISIVIGVGITQLLLSMSSLIREPKFKPEQLYLMWFTIVFILNVEFIWNLRLQTTMSLSLVRALIYMLGPIALFLLTDILTIRDHHNGPLSSLPNQPTFFAATIAYLASQILVAVLLRHESFSHPQNWFRYGSIALLTVGLLYRSSKLQYSVAAIALLTMTAYIITTDYLPNASNYQSCEPEHSATRPLISESSVRAGYGRRYPKSIDHIPELGSA